MSSAPLRIGFDIGGTKCAAVLVDGDGSVRREHRVATPKRADALIGTILEVVARFRVGVELGGVGIGVPGLISPDGVLRFAGHLPGIVELPVAEIVHDAIGVPVVVLNDNRCAAWAEHAVGAGRGIDDLLYVGFGTGIGGGVVHDGSLLRGAHGFATEIGHITLDVNGPDCSCGRRGCWELYASGNGLGRLAREAAAAGRLGADPASVRGEDVVAAAADGDAGALAVVGEWAAWVAEGLASLTMVFDPARIVLGGGALSTMRDGAAVVLAPVRDALATLLGHGGAHRPMPDVVAAALGPRAGAIGAALLAGGGALDRYQRVATKSS